MRRAPRRVRRAGRPVDRVVTQAPFVFGKNERPFCGLSEVAAFASTPGVASSRAHRASLAERVAQTVTQLGNSVRTSREALGMTVEEAAGRMELDPRNLRRIESARSDLRIGTLLRIADGLGLSGAALIERAEMQTRGAVDPRVEREPLHHPSGSREAGLRVANNIAALRKRSRLTQRELAQRAGLGLATVQSVERGRHAPTLVTLDALARALGCSLAELQREDGEPAPPVLRVRKRRGETSGNS
jgi:transcriptional regulator with XRE-family HTH domain